MVGRYYIYWKKTRYITQRKKAHNIIRCEKIKYVQNIIQEAKFDYKTHRTRQLYRKINEIKERYKGQKKFLRNKNGELITTKIEIAKR